MRQATAVSLSKPQKLEPMENGMRERIGRAGVLIVLVLFYATSVSLGQGGDKTERIFFNAKVFTGVPERPYAEAVAIRGDKIVAVGNLAEVSRAAGKNAEQVDLGGRALLPGLIDSHIHAIEGGLTLTSSDVSDHLNSMDELVMWPPMEGSPARACGATSCVSADCLSFTGRGLTS
jgi:hypothetical protein